MANSMSNEKKYYAEKMRNLKTEIHQQASEKPVCSYHGKVIIAWEEGGPKQVDIAHLHAISNREGFARKNDFQDYKLRNNCLKKSARRF